MRDKPFKDVQHGGRKAKKGKETLYISGLIATINTRGRAKNSNATFNKMKLWDNSEASQQKLISSKSGLLNSSKEKSESSHEAMLQDDVRKFRIEVERRFKNSKENREYIFPRKDRINELKHTEDISCTFTLNFN
eukprot:TRINITY_DN2489_c0_g1_i15.p3 TRINITY_DN2489_c0_g1~~TRINITY_DN2489_c0_g1_i15.p3  ORF type:complete len:135 (+),score=9.42 TRINITY_DN2489_c0_g1_i15:575-979(+)